MDPLICHVERHRNENSKSNHIIKQSYTHTLVETLPILTSSTVNALLYIIATNDATSNVNDDYTNIWYFEMVEAWSP